jgi:hypothetical protein
VEITRSTLVRLIPITRSPGKSFISETMSKMFAIQHSDFLEIVGSLLIEEDSSSILRYISYTSIYLFTCCYEVFDVTVYLSEFAILPCLKNIDVSESIRLCG